MAIGRRVTFPWCHRDGSTKRAGRQSSTTQLRLATFNIKHGLGNGDRVDHAGLVRACRELDADLVGLQEVDRRRLRSGMRDQAALVARRCGYEHVFAPVLRQGALGQYGNALLARGAVSDVEMLELPRPSTRQARGAILARVALRCGPVTVAVTHLQHHPAHRRDEEPEAPMQLRALFDVLATRPGPRLLLGDFNLQPDRARPIVERAGFHLAGESLTFPAADARIKLDYIAVDVPGVAERETVVTAISDHRALVATMDCEAVTTTHVRRVPVPVTGGSYGSAGSITTPGIRL